MTPEGLGSRRLRFHFGHTDVGSGPSFSTADELISSAYLPDERLTEGIARTRDYLLRTQHAEGFWIGELEGDTILESEYILLLAYLGREQSETAKLCANYILKQQLLEGGWAIYPGGPLEISASVKAYFALKLTGTPVDAPEMLRAKAAILNAGGAEKVNSFTRYYLALLGILSYQQCPAVPPELILLPKWMPFNIYEMSSWSRTIIVPLSLLWAFRPKHTLPDQMRIDELFHNRPEDLPLSMGPSDALDGMKNKTRVDWGKVFRGIDRTIKFGEKLHLRPFRKLAIKRAAAWMLARFENSDGLGAIFPPIIWSVVALKCLGYSEDSPEIQLALKELDKLSIREGETIRLEPCRSPVWDTAIATIALSEAETPVEHPAMKRSLRWLLANEIRQPGDWSVRDPETEPAGWCFEFNNAFYPDTDDTCMVLMALARMLPDGQRNLWQTDFLFDRWSPHAADADAAAVVSARHTTREGALEDVLGTTDLLKAIWRGGRWILAMQGSDGGWGAFDKDNTREIFTRVPFADHNAMIDPSTADLTARMLEMFAGFHLPQRHDAVQKAIDFVWKEQEPDGCWYGRWGVNYLYGTWQALVGLTAIGISPDDPRIRRGVAWLKSRQQASGGWGETPRSYDDPTLRGVGEATASQTAWALMGLLAAGEVHSDAVARGVEYLLQSQCSDGTWDEPQYTGTGFPRVFYLRYHLYRIYFPLMALGRYNRLRQGRA